MPPFGPLTNLPVQGLRYGQNRRLEMSKMKYMKQLRYGFFIAALFLCAGKASAQTGQQFGTGTSLSNLAVSATFQTAIKLDITSASAGAAVTGTAGSGTFSVAFGNVNGLGLGTPSTGITKTAVGTTGFMYTTPITLTPSFSGFAPATATITVGQDAADDAASKLAAHEGADAASVAILPATAVARIVTAAATNGTAFDRYIGVFVPNGNAGTNIAGLRTMNLVYTITCP